MRFVNLSHGAFAMVGGYCAALLVREAQWSFWLAVPVAIALTGLLGAVLEALVLRHLYRRKELDQVLFTIGLTFVLIAATNALAGPQVQLIPLPPVLAGSVDLGLRTLPAQRLLVIGAGLRGCGRWPRGRWRARDSASGCARRSTTAAPPPASASRSAWCSAPASRPVPPWPGWAASWVPS